VRFILGGREGVERMTGQEDGYPFPKRIPQDGEIHCPYDGVAYSSVPGYISGYGCPVCGAIGAYHLPIKKDLTKEEN